MMPQITAAPVRSFTPAHLPDRADAANMARRLGLPLLDLDAFDYRCFPQQLVDESLLRRHQVLPLAKVRNQLYLAMADPANASAIKDIEFHTGLRVEIIVVTRDQLRASIAKWIANQRFNQPLHDNSGDMGIANLAAEPARPTDDSDNESVADEAPIVRFVHTVFVEAIKAHASDIHLEPYEHCYRVRFRVDGMLREIVQPPLHFAGRIAARIKVMAQLDISEKRIPQDGRIKLKLSRLRTFDFRVNFLPTLWGEKIVLRLVDPAATRLDIDSLGFSDDQKQLYLQALHRSQGLVLVTGPTGSGKSATLYAGLGILNSTERNIATAEDPVELPVPGINQVSINPRCGLDFAAALRAFLRQDPDVIMVGEIRDVETAVTALRAAQTGHLVLSTLHTSSAADSITRLYNMGVAAYNIASSVSLVIAQKLARRLCCHCKEKTTYSEKEMTAAGFAPAQLASVNLYRAVGCHRCASGYKGRIGIFEVVPITPDLSGSIIGGVSSSELAHLIRAAGFASLRQSALRQVASGQISLEEANRLV